MKICAIICEYNPMHNGHIHQIRELKEKYGIDKIIGIMSGNFSERGTPCIMDKYTRAEIAISSGLDMVVQIPTVYSLSSANIFARAGVKIASMLGVDYLSFGCEDEPKNILELSKIVSNEHNSKLHREIVRNTKEGLPYPKALCEALINTLDKNSKFSKDYLRRAMAKPNNILALEYLNALRETNIEPIIVTRDSDYHSQTLDNLSSSAIRKYVKNNEDLSRLKVVMPKYGYKYLCEFISKYGKVDGDRFNDLMLDCVKLKDRDSMLNISTATGDLVSYILAKTAPLNNAKDLADTLDTKVFTKARISRFLTNNMLNIPQIPNIMTESIEVPYIKVLAMRKDKPLISRLSHAPLVMRKSDADRYAKFVNFTTIEDRANSIYYRLLDKHKVTRNTNPDLYIPTIFD